MRISMNRALIVALTAALLVGLVPATLVLDRRLAATVERRARAELEGAPALLADRETMSADMLAMHARDLARLPQLATALAAGAQARAVELAVAAASENEVAIVVDEDGRVWAGPEPGPVLLEATRRGGAPVAVIAAEDRLLRVALSAVTYDGAWVGAAGVAVEVGATAAATLAGLTRADVLIFAGNRVVASTLDAVPTRLIDSAGVREDGGVREVATAGGRRFFVAAAQLGEGTVAFVRDREVELAVVPALRRTVLLVVGVAVLVTILLGAGIAGLATRPAAALAHAADRLAVGDFAAPVSPSSIREIDRMGNTFVSMRTALAERLRELENANRELENRQRRLASLQTELIQRDRLAASGRLVAGLAHEIRNPVANVRNCIEVIRRRLADDEKGREFADLAIDELLRMHELAERMLDMHRPEEPGVATCDAAAVVRDLAAILRVGSEGSHLTLKVRTPAVLDAAIPRDALIQVLLNVVQNAREAVADHGTTELTARRDGDAVLLEVVDDGPGIDEDSLGKLFDPFFTTKQSVHGVGLGLFVAEGIVRRYGGRIVAANRSAVGTGAVFRVELPAANRSVETTRPPAVSETEAEA
jgi:signal transduction histidine kinase